MYQVNSYLCLFCLLLVAVLTGVDATCDGAAECLNNYNYSMDGTDLSVNSASELDSYCQTFESVRGCVEHELPTCYQEELDEEWLSHVSKEQYLCSTEGRLLFLTSVNCLETSQKVAEAGACSSTYSTSVDLVSQSLDSGYYDSAEAAHRDLCRATDELYKCNCNAVRPACGQDAATFYHTYLVKATEASWSSFGCPALYGSPTSCNGGNQGGSGGGATSPPPTPLSTESQNVEATCNDIKSCIPDVHSRAVPGLEAYGIATDDDLSRYCAEFAEQKKCVEKIEPCHNPVLSEWKMNTLNKALYVCSDEGRRLYSANSECLHSQRRKKATDGCLVAFSRTISSVDNYDSGEDIVRVGNSALHKAFGCFCAEVLQICGQDAATYYHTYTYRQYEVVWREVYGGPAAYSDLTPCGRARDPTSEAPTAVWLLFLGLLTTKLH